MSESEAATVDRIQAMLIERARSCLTHVRKVQWGEATASYTVQDGDLSLDVLVRVTCLRKADRADA